jgi:hypothetical protein
VTFECLYAKALLLWLKVGPSLSAVNDQLDSSAWEFVHAIRLVDLMPALIVPFLPLYKILATTYPNHPWTNATLVTGYACCFVGWIGLALVSFFHSGLYGMSISLFIMTGAILTWIRFSLRSHRDVVRFALVDFADCTIYWPLVLVHMQLGREPAGLTKMKSGKVAVDDHELDCYMDV